MSQATVLHANSAAYAPLRGEVKRPERDWVPLIYIPLTLLITYPLVFRLGSHYVGTGGDLFIFPWNDWWCRKCLLEGRNPLFTTWLFYPSGVSLVYHNFAWLNTAMWLPLSPLIGPVAAYNVIFLFNLTLGGTGMYLLARYLTESRQAAFIAGLIFAFWPCRMSHYNHPNMISVGWVPLFMLFLIRTVRCQRRNHAGQVATPATGMKSALVAGLFLALTGLARWLHLMFASGMALLYLAYSVSFERRHWTRRTVAALILAFGVAMVLMAPLLSPLVSAQVRGSEKAEDVFSTDPDLYSTDLVSYFVPDRSHPLFRPWLSDLWSRMRRGSYFGYAALALAIVGLLKGRRDRFLWFIIGLGLFVLALGPHLQVGGRSLDVTLPYSWVQDWSVVRVVRHPNRFNVLLSLPLAVLAGYGVAWLLPLIQRVARVTSPPLVGGREGGVAKRPQLIQRIAKRPRLKRPWLWTAGIGALVLFEYLPWPYPTVQPPMPAFYRQLAQEPGDFAILDLPMGDRTVAKVYMYYATVHGKPLVEGHVSRLPVSAYGFIDSSPLLHGLHQSNEMDPTLGDISRQLSVLADADVRYLILHPDLVPPEQLSRWRSWLAIRPTFEDQDTVVYRTQPRYTQDFKLAEEMTDGIGIIRIPDPGAHSETLSLERETRATSPSQAGGTTEVTQGEWLKVEVIWGTRKAPERDFLARLALVSPDGTEAQWADFEPCADWPTSQWGADAVARGRGALQVDPFIEGGAYTVTVGLVDPATGARVGQVAQVGAGRVKIRARERVFDQPEMEVPVGATFGDASGPLQLLGYDLRQEARTLALTLHWRGLRRMDVRYKFFVHLFDTKTGELVAQADVMPRDWTYPTTWWEKGEVVSDEIILSDVPSGTYRVRVGVYEPESDARLPVMDAAGASELGDRLSLIERLVLR